LRPGAIRSEVGTADMKFVPSYLLRQLATTITKKFAKVVKKLSKSYQKVQKVVKKLSRSCQKVVQNFVAPGKNQKKVNRPENKNKKKVKKSCQKVVKKLSKNTNWFVGNPTTLLTHSDKKLS
jgi:signal recognition particle subunit SEC65